MTRLTAYVPASVSRGDRRVVRRRLQAIPVSAKHERGWVRTVRNRHKQEERIYDMRRRRRARAQEAVWGRRSGPVISCRVVDLLPPPPDTHWSKQANCGRPAPGVAGRTS